VVDVEMISGVETSIVKQIVETDWKKIVALYLTKMYLRLLYVKITL